MHGIGDGYVWSRTRRTWRIHGDLGVGNDFTMLHDGERRHGENLPGNTALGTASRSQVKYRVSETRRTATTVTAAAAGGHGHGNGALDGEEEQGHGQGRTGACWQGADGSCGQRRSGMPARRKQGRGGDGEEAAMEELVEARSG